MAKAKFLLFDSTSEARLIKGNVKDGLATIDNKTFFVDESTPILLKGTRGFTPLYIIKWSDIQPSTSLNPIFRPNSIETGNPTVKPENPRFKEGKNPEKELTPELLRKLIGIKILGNMIKTKRKIEMGGLTMLALGAGSAILILYALSYFGILQL